LVETKKLIDFYRAKESFPPFGIFEQTTLIPCFLLGQVCYTEPVLTLPSNSNTVHIYRPRFTLFILIFFSLTDFSFWLYPFFLSCPSHFIFLIYSQPITYPQKHEQQCNTNSGYVSPWCIKSSSTTSRGRR